MTAPLIAPLIPSRARPRVRSNGGPPRSAAYQSPLRRRSRRSRDDVVYGSAAMMYQHATRRSHPVDGIAQSTLTCVETI
jgi:hypothetical protein